MADASKCRRPWSADEDELLSDPALTVHELTARTERTLAAIRRRRGVLRRGGTAERFRPWGIDPPLLHKAPRPCSACGQSFQPTMRRRLLCHRCFAAGDGGPMAA